MPGTGNPKCFSGFLSEARVRVCDLEQRAHVEEREAGVQGESGHNVNQTAQQASNEGLTCLA